jgi:hypothetical protein
MTDFSKHVALVYKSPFIPHKPWCADVVAPDGDYWKLWQCGYTTRKATEEAITGFAAEMQIRRVSYDYIVELQRKAGL